MHDALQHRGAAGDLAMPTSPDQSPKLNGSPAGALPWPMFGAAGAAMEFEPLVRRALELVR